MSEAQVELVRGIKFAESPRWRDGRLWFSDVHDYAVKCVDLDGNLRRVAEVADLTEIATATLNDMVVDERGRAYVGDVGFRFGAEEPRPGRVILWSEAEGARVAAEDTVFPNGCAVDGDRYVLAETLAKRVSEFRVAADGSLGDRRVLAQLDDPPDGLCLDAEGCAWVAQPEESRYLRLAPDGSVDRVVPSAWPFAVTCVLGGEDGRTLFLSSADTDLRRLPQGESSGRIDALRVDVPGAGRP